MTELSKLQIRAKVLSVISEIKLLKSYNADILSNFTKELEEITDKKTLLDIFLKEFIKMSENEYVFSGCLLKNLIPVEYVEDKVLENLKLNSLSDDSKYKLVQLLRIMGGNCNFNEIPSYFENPEEVLDLETKKMLENAVYNPESMLDFLDFVSAVSKNDRNILLNSLSQDYKGDVLANIIYPILYSDFDDEFIYDVIEILAESKSSLAIAPFNYIIKTSSNDSLVNACKVGLKKLKIAGASLEKAEEYFKNIIKDTFIAQIYATIPDGNSNQAFLISRVNKQKRFLLSAIVINDIKGIVDCFGFYNISEDELVKIIAKFYQNEGKYKVSPQYAKTRIQEAVNITIKNKRTFPYEFLCWNPLLADIDELNSGIIDYVNENCSIIDINKEDVLSILTKEYTYRWFISPSENETIKKITDNIYENDSVDIELINDMLRKSVSNVFNEYVINNWLKKLYNLIYILEINNMEKDANIFYSILNNECYFNIFKSVIIQRSIFNHFILLKENSKTNIFSSNLFKKKNSNDKKYDVKKIDRLIDIMSKSWINE